MKPLYYCSICGRLSTRLDSYRCIQAQLYCANEKCSPSDSRSCLKGIANAGSAGRSGRRTERAKMTKERITSVPEKLETALTALRRIRSLEEKNVPKYAQQIAKEALNLIEKVK